MNLIDAAVLAAQASPNRAWCVTNHHPAATHNERLDATWCLCSEYRMPGDHGAVVHALAEGSSWSDKSPVRVVTVLRESSPEWLAAHPTSEVGS